MVFDPESILPPGAKIKVVGIGGGGGNAINTMIRANLEGVDFISVNTDVQALRFSLAPLKVQIGKGLTKGLGAGADPDVGWDAALEDRLDIQEFISGADMVFITAGIGGGTGTGGAPVIAQLAREMGILSVAVVTKPFNFEGKRRRKHAEIGIANLRDCVDTLITIPNQRLLQVATPELSMLDAFRLVDNILLNAVRSISDIVNVPGTVNVDFADVKTVMANMGQALMGTGSAAGENRATEAARQAISSPLLEDVDIEGATGLLINISAGSSVTLMEINEACSIVQEAAHEDANIIFGAVIDENLGDTMRVTVIATGFPVDVEEVDTIDSLRRQQQHNLARGLRNLTVPNGPQGKERLQGATAAPNAVAFEAPKPASPPLDPVAPDPDFDASAKTEGVDADPFCDGAEAEESALAFDGTGDELIDDQAAPPQKPLISMNAVEEAQELAKWTMGWSPSEAEGSGEASAHGELAGDGFDIDPNQDVVADNASGDAAASDTADEPWLESAPGERRLDGATHFDVGGPVAANDFDDPVMTADLLFGRAENAVAGDLHETKEETSAAGAQLPPLEPFFDNEALAIVDEIDRKIDDALQRAEQAPAPETGSAPEKGEDELDIPAFLRAGMKDLSLE